MSPDDEDLAAEYALGALDAAERAEVAARRLREPDLDAAISAWEARLAPLLEAAPERAPPAGLFERIEARLDGGGGVVVELRARVARWRATAAGAGALAAALAAALAFFVVARPTPAASVRRHPAKEPRRAGFRDDRRHRQAAILGQAGGGPGAAGQILRIVDHPAQAGAEVARRH